MRQGIIEKVRSDPRSGMAQILFTNRKKVLIDSGFGLRQLADAFDDDPIGKEIVYSVNKYNVMIGFDIVE